MLIITFFNTNEFYNFEKMLFFEHFKCKKRTNCNLRRSHKVIILELSQKPKVVFYMTKYIFCLKRPTLSNWCLAAKRISRTIENSCQISLIRKLMTEQCHYQKLRLSAVHDSVIVNQVGGSSNGRNLTKPSWATNMLPPSG